MYWYRLQIKWEIKKNQVVKPGKCHFEDQGGGYPKIIKSGDKRY
jgi:hypothetical protein